MRILRPAIFALSLGALLTACGAHSQTPGGPTIEDLRSLARENPNDPDAQRELAFAELLMAGGSAERAGPQIDRALELAGGDERLIYLAGLLHDLHGRPAEALARYLEAVDAARASSRAVAPFVAEVALASIGDLEEQAPAWLETVRPRLLRAAGQPDRMGAAARHQASSLLIEIAFRRGDPALARRLAVEQGCVAEWGVAGPFGPRALLGFDRSFPAERAEALAPSYDLGPGRGERETREVEARGCAAHLGGGPVAGGGTTYAEAFVEVPREGDYVLRLETPNAVEVFVDGESVVRLDHRATPTARVTFHTLSLSAGSHELEVKVTTRHPNPILVVSLTTPDGRAPGARTGEHFDVGRPAGQGPFAAYLRAAVAMTRGDPVGAREALRGPITRRGATAAVLQLRSAIALADPLRPPDMSRDEARRLLRQAARRDELSWFPPVQLARLEAADGRVLAAIAALREASERWPGVVSIPLTLTDLLIGRGWTAEADLAVERAREINPDGCSPMRGAMAAAQRRNRASQVEELATQLVGCDARSNALYQVLLRKRDWDGAGQEVDRLASLEPRHDRLGILSARLEIARSRGEGAEVDRLLAEMRELNPRSVLTPIAQADRLLAAERPDDAQRLLTEGVEAEPASLAELRLLNRAIGGPFALSAFRLDGAEVIREFEASGRTYDQPQVLVLDYTVVRVFEDGSTLELTHNIWRVQSEEAVDERGEFSPPEGATVLRLHTIKADGRRMEPDQILGKSTISLPQVAPGDYVEYEYVSFGEPANGFPGGYLGDRFYFRSFETPYDRSELTLVLPRGMEPIVDPRGPAPETEERLEEDVRVLHWIVHESRPFVPEPATVAPREWIPSVNTGVGATWERFAEGLQDILADRSVRDPAARRTVMHILGEARRASDVERARRLYTWVLRNVEDTDEIFGLAPAMLVERTGNRARILHYMLALAGVETDLVLARSAGGDATRSEVADGDTYRHLLVRLGEGEGEVFLSTVDRGAPFGYVPPLIRGQEGLVLAAGAPRVTVSDGAEGADRRTVEVDVNLRRDGSATVDVVETFRGAGAVSWRSELEGIPEATLEQRFEEAYVTQLVPGASLSRLRITGRREPESPLVLAYTFDVGALGRSQGSRWIVPGLFPTNLSPVYARVGARTTSQLVSPPIDLRVVLRMHVPEGAELPAPPETISLEGPGGASFRVSATHRDGALIVERRVNISISRIAAEIYPRFAAFCRSVDEAEARQLRLRL